MKNAKKRILSGILAACMICGLTACGGGPEPDIPGGPAGSNIPDARTDPLRYHIVAIRRIDAVAGSVFLVLTIIAAGRILVLVVKAGHSGTRLVIRVDARHIRLRVVLHEIQLLQRRCIRAAGTKSMGCP